MTPLPARRRRAPRPARRGWPRLLVAVLLATMGLLATGPTTPARADDAQAWITVTLSSVSPAVPGQDATITLTGTATNTSDTTLYNVQAMICRSQTPITDETQMHSALGDDAENPPCFRISDYGTFQQLTRGQDPATKDLPPSLPPGASAHFTVKASLQQFTFPPSPGVYVVGVHVMGRSDGPRGRDHVLGRGRTFLPVGVSDFHPDQRATVASVVVLTARPTVIREGVFTDNTLADAIADDGELGRLLALSSHDHDTFVVDPQLVAAVRMLTRPYHVEDGGHLTAHPASSDAQQWLDRLDALPHDRLYQLPYADPDLAALAHSGHEGLYRPALGGDILPGVDTLVLPAGGYADAATLALAARGDPAAVLLARDSTGAADAVTAGRNGVPVISYAADAMDGGPAPDPRTTPTQIRQRFLADTYLHARNGRDTATVRLITTARQAASLPHANAPWLTTTTLHHLLQGTPASSPDSLSYPPSAAGQELTGEQVGAVAALAEDLRTYTALTSGSATLDTDARLTIARGLGAGWRGDPDGLRDYLQAQRSQIDAALDGSAVHLGKHSNVVLSGKEGFTSVTVTNNLDVPVRIDVHFTSGNALRLAVKDLAGKQIPAHTSRAFRVEMTPRANGEVPVRVQLQTTTGVSIGEPVSFTVHATEYGLLGWIIAVGAAIVLFVSTFLRIRQVRREKAKETGTAGAAPPGPSPGG